jgi:hypothetical protein
METRIYIIYIYTMIQGNGILDPHYTIHYIYIPIMISLYPLYPIIYHSIQYIPFMIYHTYIYPIISH